jgi:hypothetical protein
MSSTISSWQPRTPEDRLIYRYWQEHEGRLFLEVPIGGAGGSGNWENGCTTRRIDAVVVGASRAPSIALRYAQAGAREFENAIKGAGPVLIEAKTTLNRTAIGQAIAARHMFIRQYHVRPSMALILCSVGDSALEWVCAREHLGVEIIKT